jgi:hypothetical protein
MLRNTKDRIYPEWMPLIVAVVGIERLDQGDQHGKTLGFSVTPNRGSDIHIVIGVRE